jgi:hypothetical protein
MPKRKNIGTWFEERSTREYENDRKSKATMGIAVRRRNPPELRDFFVRER